MGVKQKETIDNQNFREKGKLQAIEENFAVIEFEPDGTILEANDNFFQAMGYTKKEIASRHHRMFCPSEVAESIEYKQFWLQLAEGIPQIGEFHRVNKAGDDLYLYASYTPIKDEKGKVVRVIKFAQDITDSKNRSANFEGQLKAIDLSQAVIEFNLDGIILTANENFLLTVGYSLAEIQGKHHRMFCEPDYANSIEYKQFWNKLNAGEFDAGEYKRLGKNGKEIWINASYNPIYNAAGKLVKVVKFASNVTEQKVRNADFEGQLKAIDLSQAVIEFELDGMIINANQNFLSTVGYSMEEIRGKHHRIFCEPEYAASNEYKHFWQKLNSGEFDAGEYKRIGKGGKEIWIQASYNPIRDINGKVIKVVKYASDLTKEKVAYNNLVDTFETAAKEVFSFSQSLGSVANQLSSNAEGTMQKSKSATTSTEETLGGVQNVSASTEELTASIAEIAQGSQKANRISNEAKEQSERAGETVKGLGVASEDIGNVIKVISSIAQQTNLLALNATIEAARAGEAGKGFSVVANEVKELAKQTAVATDEISSKISNVQENTTNAIQAISGISHIIDELNQINATTAAAMEEQAATTKEVSRILTETNGNMDNVAQVIRDVSASAQDSSESAQTTLESASKLDSISQNLLKLIEQARKN